MMLQVMREYRGLPDYRGMTLEEIEFFYDGLRAELKKKPPGK